MRPNALNYQGFAGIVLALLLTTTIAEAQVSEEEFSELLEQQGVTDEEWQKAMNELAAGHVVWIGDMVLHPLRLQGDETPKQIH